MFVAPAIPSPTGSGLRMRGHLFLRALARHHLVTLVAGSPAFPSEVPAALEPVRDLVEEAIVLPFGPRRDPGRLWPRLRALAVPHGHPKALWAAPTPRMRRSLARLAGRFERLHVFRLYMLPVAQACGGGTSAPFDLDLDDWESETSAAAGVEASARAWEPLERQWLPRAERVFVCSDPDARSLRARHGLNDVETVPNAVPVPETLARETPDGPPELLFVGSLGHAPNQAAVRFLLDEVLPLCQAAGTRDFVLVIAGSGAPRWLSRRLLGDPRVRFVEAPATIEPLYGRAWVALAPLQSGGGTRLKVLEAFAQGRPLIASPAAVAGLDVAGGVHYAAARVAGEWAEAIRNLLSSARRRRELAAAAYEWVRPRSLEAAITSLADRWTSRPSGGA